MGVGEGGRVRWARGGGGEYGEERMWGGVGWGITSVIRGFLFEAFEELSFVMHVMNVVVGCCCLGVFYLFDKTSLVDIDVKDNDDSAIELQSIVTTPSSTAEQQHQQVSERSER